MSKGNLNELRDRVHALARAKGWYENRDVTDVNAIGSALALIHSEVSEALEDVRKGRMVLSYVDTETGESLTAAQRDEAIERDEEPASQFKPVGFPSEMADVAIRVLDLCGALNVDIQHAVDVKHAFNAMRPHRHGGKRL
jgi:NTP pyrophosphatase (non-canonical NTP hydrolase)